MSNYKDYLEEGPSEAQAKENAKFLADCLRERRIRVTEGYTKPKETVLQFTLFIPTKHGMVHCTYDRWGFVIKEYPQADQLKIPQIIDFIMNLQK